MNEIYCSKCGRSCPLGSNFCQACGKNLKTLSADPAPPPAPPAPKYRPKPAAASFTPFDPNSDEDGDDEYIDYLTHLDVKIDRLNVEIVKDRPLGESLGSIAAQGGGGGAPVESRHGEFGGVDNETFQKLFSQEAGTIRK
jgi:hypothetical protein